MAAVAVATTGLRGRVDDSIAINHLLGSGLCQWKHTIKNRASTGIGSVLCLLYTQTYGYSPCSEKEISFVVPCFAK